MRFLQKTFAAAGLAVITVMAGATPSQAQFSGCGTSEASGNIFGEDGFLAFITANGSCTIGDKTYSQFNTDEWDNFPTDATINISESGGGLTHTISLTSSAGFSSVNGKSTEYDFDYEVAVTPPSGNVLDQWRPGSTSSLFNQDWALTTTATNPLTSIIRDETTGLSPLSNFDPNTTSSFFTNTLVVNAGFDGVGSITQTVSQVPGPLPILGAGAAFGFSRKLRSRIKRAA